MKSSRSLPTCLALLAATCALAAPAKGPRRGQPAKPRGNQATLTIDAGGLRPDSSRLFAVYQGDRCVKIGRIGPPTVLPPGKYDVKVGFTSGWMSEAVELLPKSKLRVATGLFRFRDLTPKGSPTAVPQKLYRDDLYLTTGYRGMTARLFPGTYTVRYHLPSDNRPARSLRQWWMVGPFPGFSKQDQALVTPYPPEKQPPARLRQGFTVRGQKHAWQRVGGGLTMDLRQGKKLQGIAYLATEIPSESEREVELAFVHRDAIKVWVNGKLLKALVPTRSYLESRTETHPTLRKGTNVVLVKTFVRAYASWPFTAILEDWHSYQVAVEDDGGTRAAAASQSASATTTVAKPLPPVQGIKGIVFCQVPNLPNGVSGLHYEQFRIVRRPTKARICSLIPASPTGKFTDLTSKHFVAAMQPDLSYDGTKIVFTARKTSAQTDHWNVHEMNLDGSGLRQITRGLKDCLDPHYLPCGRIVFSSNCADFRDEYDRDVPPLLHTCNPDGSDVEKISFNLSSDTASIVLHDGRILFTSWQHHGDHQGVAGNFAFCAINPDGTGFNLFTGNAGPLSKTKSYAQQLTDGRVVFIETAGHRHYNAGILTAVHPRKPLTTRQILTPGVHYNGINTGGRYASPYPLPDGGMLVAYSPGRATASLQTDPAEEIHLGIYQFGFQAGRPARLLFDDPNAQDFDPIAIYARPKPPIIPRMVNPKKKTGVMTCVNAYLNDRPRQTKRVVVGELPPAKPGELKWVRVAEGFGIHDKDPRKYRRFIIDLLQMSFGSSKNGGSNFEQKKILGYAPIEPDGSFSVEVPADTVLSLQTCDANYMATNTQLTWTWVRPGETRLCVGCHESREMALPNLDCKALARTPSFVAPPPEKRRAIDFRRDIMPVIETRCSSAKCHGLPAKAGGLDLRKGFELVFHRSGNRGRKLNGAFFNHAYESLLQAPLNRVGTLVMPGAARYSPLIWRLYGKKLAHTDGRNPYKKPCKQMPPGKPLPDPEKRLFVEWIDLGAQWDNIIGDDDLPGYDADESRKMAKAAQELVSKPIPHGEKAFKVRCFECHDARRMAGLRNYSPAKVPAMVKRMSAKRRTWIHDSEIPLIIEHIRDVCLKPARKKR